VNIGTGVRVKRRRTFGSRRPKATVRIEAQGGVNSIVRRRGHLWMPIFGLNASRAPRASREVWKVSDGIIRRVLVGRRHLGPGKSRTFTGARWKRSRRVES
jgi:hypothetical protein